MKDLVESQFSDFYRNFSEKKIFVGRIEPLAKKWKEKRALSFHSFSGLCDINPWRYKIVYLRKTLKGILIDNNGFV
jgi:hypothetical protein